VNLTTILKHCPNYCQGYTIKELSHIFQVDRITIYNWFDHWESRRFAGLYDRAGKGRPPLFNQDQKEQIRDWIKQYPKNLNKSMALIQQEFNVRASKSTIKRVLKSMKLTWRRIRRKVNDQPDPETYQQKREALEILIAEDQEGIIDLRYFDESGFCLVPYTYRSVIFGDKSQIALSSGDE
jgi:transposase